MGYLTLDQSACQPNIECRLMKLGHPMARGPFQLKALYLVTHTRMEGFLFSRHAVIDAVHVASGRKVTFSGIGPEFALTLFSNKKF